MITVLVVGYFVGLVLMMAFMGHLFERYGFRPAGVYNRNDIISASVMWPVWILALCLTYVVEFIIFVFKNGLTILYNFLTHYSRKH